MRLRESDEVDSPLALNRLSPDDSPNASVVGILVLLGLLLLAHPLYLYPHYNQTPYGMQGVTKVTGETPPESAVIAYAALPPEAQQAFDATRRGEFHTLYDIEHAKAVETLQQYEYIRFDGAVYRYSFTHIDKGASFAGLVRGLLTSLGTFLVILGGLVHYAGTWEPLTPLRSLWFPVGAVLGLVGTQLYDVWYVGITGALPLPNSLSALIPVAVLFLTVGSLVRRSGRAVLYAVAGVSAVGVAVYAGYIHFVTPPPLGNTSPIVAAIRFALFLGLIFTVGTAPWYGLGYLLTKPDHRSTNDQ